MNPEVFSLNSLIDYHNHQISSRGLSRKLNTELPITIYALDAGESISNEQTSLTKLIQIIDGSLVVNMNGETFPLNQGEIMAIPANTLHEIQANHRCKYLQIESEPKKG